MQVGAGSNNACGISYNELIARSGASRAIACEQCVRFSGSELSLNGTVLRAKRSVSVFNDVTKIFCILVTL